MTLGNQPMPPRPPLHPSQSGTHKPPGKSGSFQSPIPPIPQPKSPPEEEPIALVDDPIAADGGTAIKPGEAPTIKPTGAAAASAVRAIKTTLDMGKRTQFKRQPVNTGAGATRCRMFHCKVAESSMEHMENQINIWLDDEDVDIKHVGHLVGALEGKHTEPNIIVLIWY